MHCLLLSSFIVFFSLSLSSVPICIDNNFVQTDFVLWLRKTSSSSWMGSKWLSCKLKRAISFYLITAALSSSSDENLLGRRFNGRQKLWLIFTWILCQNAANVVLSGFKKTTSSSFEIDFFKLWDRKMARVLASWLFGNIPPKSVGLSYFLRAYQKIFFLCWQNS